MSSFSEWGRGPEEETERPKKMTVVASLNSFLRENVGLHSSRFPTKATCSKSYMEDWSEAEHNGVIRAAARTIGRRAFCDYLVTTEDAHAAGHQGQGLDIIDAAPHQTWGGSSMIFSSASLCSRHRPVIEIIEFFLPTLIVLSGSFTSLVCISLRP